MDNNRNQYVLLTGGTGFLGSFLALKLLQEGFEVTFLARSENENQSKEHIIRRLSALGLKPHCFSQIHVVAGDVTKPLCGVQEKWVMKHKDKIHAFWHLAALVQFSDRANLFSTNREGTEHAIELTKVLNAHFHYVSTVFVAGNLKQNQIVENEISEPAHFRNAYEESKYQAEKLVRHHTSIGEIKSTIYRPSILIGHSQTGQAFSFTGYYVPLYFFYTLRQFLEHHHFLSRFPIVIPYRPKAVLNLIPIDHTVRIMYSLSQLPSSVNNSFHVIHQNPPKVDFIFKESLQLIGYPSVYVIPTPWVFMKLIKASLETISYLFGKSGRLFRVRFGAYFDYFIDTRIFPSTNTRSLIGKEADIPPLDSEFFRRCVTYAKRMHFAQYSSHAISSKQVHSVQHHSQKAGILRR